MKKLLVVLSAFALSLSLANAQMRGDGEGSTDGSGPHGPFGGMWAALVDLVEPDSVQATLLGDITTLRDNLRTSREEWLADPDNDSLAGWSDQEAVRTQINELKTKVEDIRNWYREERPDRPDPVMTGNMIRRRLQFKTNSEGITQVQKRLRLMLQEDPDNPECQQLREQLKLRLGERKQLLREQRRDEGGPGGEGDGNHRGG